MRRPASWPASQGRDRAVQLASTCRANADMLGVVAGSGTTRRPGHPQTSRDRRRRSVPRFQSAVATSLVCQARAVLTVAVVTAASAW